MTSVLMLHAYSADNAGDGLLVRETLRLIREALGEDAEITLLASQPQTFENLGIHTTVRALPFRSGYWPAMRAVLREIDGFDLIVGVGGGYLRAGHVREGAKSILVHGPQLRAAARSTTAAVYMPQSIGPLRGPVRRLVRRMLRGIDHLYLRDDRSMAEVDLPNARRAPDLALLALRGPIVDELGDWVPVLSVRRIHGRVPAGVHALARLLGQYDMYVQSTVSGNDDLPATAEFSPRATIPRDQLLGKTAEYEPRIVIAVRLHAALMALRAGHYVIHLSYERKGFGAFGDLGLSDYVFNVNDFDSQQVFQLFSSLRDQPESRRAYRAAVAESSSVRRAWEQEILVSIRDGAGGSGGR